MLSVHSYKLLRRLNILLSQVGQLPRDLSRQISWPGYKRAAADDSEFSLKVLVVIHAYWPRQFGEIINQLNDINMSLTIMVTIPEGDNAPAIEDLCKNLCNRHTLVLVPIHNIGRDIAPFLECIEKFPSENWDLVIKVHTKASQDIWFKSLLFSLLRSDRRIQRHAKLLKRYPSGLIVHPLFRYPGHKQSSSEPAMQRLNALLTTGNFPIPRTWFFAAGSMFAASSESLVAIKRESEVLGLTQFESEGEYSQSSSAHMYERFLGLYFCSRGSGLLSTSSLDFFDVKALLVKLI